MPEKLSITFLLGPTGRIRTGGVACLLEYAKRFGDRGHDVSITTWPKFLWPNAEAFPGWDAGIPLHYDDKLRHNALPFHLVNRAPRDFLGELQFFVTYVNLLTPSIPPADIVIAGGWDAVMPAWLCGHGKPVHFPQHYDEVFFSLDPSSADGFLGNPLIKLLCRNTFQLPLYRVANSSWLSAEFQRRFGESVPFVNHGIDCSLFAVRPKRSAADGILRVVTYSRPDKWKGFADAVAAMQPLLARYSSRLEWHVYGFAHPGFPPDNALAPYLFHGAIEREELSKLYAESDIVVCPSWYESFPLPPLEAIACGTPVVTTAYGTEDYAIDGHTALVVQPRVPAEMTAAIERLINDDELRGRIAVNGRAMAESLTWEKAVVAREEILWSIHRNEIAADLYRGLDTRILDGNGIPFEGLVPELEASEGDILRSDDGGTYVVESGRLRSLVDPSRSVIDSRLARRASSLALARTDLGPAL
jgi:glycosyltransferase involved in cell wall biosynthesis